MDRYQRVEKPRPENPISENEIRITAQGLIRNYISYATTLLQEKRVKEIVLKAMGQAISKTVAIAEILKKNIPGLHQETAISSTSITDVWEPIEEGLVPVEMTRHVSMISITLSMKELNKGSPGYQAPAYVDQSKPHRQHYQQRPQQQQPLHQEQQQVMQAPPPVTEESYGRGRGRGRGRNFSNRGGYDSYRGGHDGGYGGRGGGYGGGRGGGYGGRGGGYGGRYSGGYGGGYAGGYGGGYDGGYGGGYDGGYGGGYDNALENGGWNNNWNGRGGRGRAGGYRGGGYERGRGGGGRGYNRGRGRMPPRGRGNPGF